MPFRFVHTADLHLDSPLRSLALRDAALAAQVGAASREVLTRIVDLCLAEAVDALLIAGDLYDGDQTSMKTAGFLLTEFRRLEAAEIGVFLIRGNHDAMARITRELVFPANVHVFGARPEARLVETAGRPVAIHGISFAQAHAPDSLLGRFAAPVPGAINIGMLHTSLGGAPGHDRYAPCTLADLQATGFDYWALGHVHARAAHAGRTHVVMPGIPQGRDMGETGEKTVSLVTISDDGAVQVETRALALLRFERIAVRLDGATDWAEAVAALRLGLQQARRTTPAEALVLRLRLEGATPLAWLIRRDRDLLEAEAASAAETIGGLWIEAVEIAVTDPAASSGAGALADLEQIVAAGMPPGPGLAQELDAAATAVLQALPPGLRDLLGDSPEASAAKRDQLLAEGAGDLLARLRGAGAE